MLRRHRLLHYSLCTISDIAQGVTTFVAGRPNGGGMYGAPTSAMNWMAYMANHGYPEILAGRRYWEPESSPFERNTSHERDPWLVARSRSKRRVPG